MKKIHNIKKGLGFLASSIFTLTLVFSLFAPGFVGAQAPNPIMDSFNNPPQGTVPAGGPSGNNFLDFPSNTTGLGGGTDGGNLPAETAGGGTDNTNSNTVVANPNAGQSQTTIKNPLKGADSLSQLVFTFVNLIYSISYVFIAFFLILSGFKFVMAQGKPEDLKNARETLKNTIIGAFILIGANVITELVKNLLRQFSNVQF